MQIDVSTPVDDETLAAITAAVALALQASAAGQVFSTDLHRSPWTAAGILAAHGIANAAMPATWGSADRAERFSRRSAGILGSFDR